MQQAVATVFGVPDAVTVEAGLVVVAFGSMRIRLETPIREVAGLAMKVDAVLVDGHWIAGTAQTVQGITHFAAPTAGARGEQARAEVSPAHTASTPPMTGTPLPRSAATQSSPEADASASANADSRAAPKPETSAARAPSVGGAFAGLARRSAARGAASTSAPRVGASTASKSDAPSNTGPKSGGPIGVGATGRPRFSADAADDFSDVPF